MLTMMENKAIGMLEEIHRCRSALQALEKENNEILEGQDQRYGEYKSKLKDTLKGELTRQSYFLLSDVLFGVDFESVNVLDKFHFVLSLEGFSVDK